VAGPATARGSTGATGRGRDDRGLQRLADDTDAGDGRQGRDQVVDHDYDVLLSDGERMTGAYALGPEAGEWMQQATLTVRARLPLSALRDVYQTFPTFSEIYVAALNALHNQIIAGNRAHG
jgi:hypothetical protein